MLRLRPLRNSTETTMHGSGGSVDWRVHDWNQVVAYSVRTPNRVHVAAGQYLYCTSPSTSPRATKPIVRLSRELFRLSPSMPTALGRTMPGIGTRPGTPPGRLPHGRCRAASGCGSASTAAAGSAPRGGGTTRRLPPAPADRIEVVVHGALPCCTELPLRGYTAGPGKSSLGLEGPLSIHK